MRVPQYKKARKAMMTVKEFIAQHMKVKNRNLDNVKLDVYLNNEIWFRGAYSPPSRIKVKAVKDGDIVRVGFVEIPKHVKFAQAKNERFHKKSEKKETPKTEEKKEEKTEEEKKAETEKEKSAAIVKEQVAEQHANAEKHTTKASTPKIHRMAMKK